MRIRQIITTNTSFKVTTCNILIQQIYIYINSVNEHHDMILYIENRNIQNTLIEQSVTSPHIIHLFTT